VTSKIGTAGNRGRGAGTGREARTLASAGQQAWFDVPRVRRRFGPVEVERLGTSVLFDFLDADLRLLWEESAAPAQPLGTAAHHPPRSSAWPAGAATSDTVERGPVAGEPGRVEKQPTDASTDLAAGVPAERSVGRRLAGLLRAEGGGVLERPEAIRAPVRRRPGERPPAGVEVVRELRVRRDDAGARVMVETTVPDSLWVAALLSADEAAGLADLLDTWR
jgi:hypothetical protein